MELPWTSPSRDGIYIEISATGLVNLVENNMTVMPFHRLGVYTGDNPVPLTPYGFPLSRGCVNTIRWGCEEFVLKPVMAIVVMDDEALYNLDGVVELEEDDVRFEFERCADGVLCLIRNNGKIVPPAEVRFSRDVKFLEKNALLPFCDSMEIEYKEKTVRVECEFKGWVMS